MMLGLESGHARPLETSAAMLVLNGIFLGGRSTSIRIIKHELP